MFYRFALILALFASIPIPASAGSPYDDDLRQLSGELRALMMRVEKRPTLDAQKRYDLGVSLFELQKRLNRLQEEAMSANIELQRSGQPKNRGLIYAASVADTLNLARAHTDAFLETGDKSFSTAAATTARIARDLMAAQQPDG